MSDFDSDPLANLANETAELRQAVGGIYQAAQQQQAHQQLVNQYQEQAAQFTQQHSDFNDAYRHVIDARQRELEAIGYTEREASQVLVQEEAAIASKALREGRNPAEAMYKLAQSRGFKAAPNTAAGIEADAAEWAEMKGEARPADPDNMSDMELDALWAKMEKENGRGPLW